MVDVWNRLSTLGSSVRWHRGALVTALVHRRAFGTLGEGSVIVAPRMLQGVEAIRIGRGVAVRDGGWLAAGRGLPGVGQRPRRAPGARTVLLSAAPGTRVGRRARGS
ncbi:hypothetical protein [Brachybacterium nesterenkovii]|uniref:Uncharacterized protein n=1 Tax=Brachybacterium nesterenkovii TaxID=47847 RepID=A0A1X6X4D9_9MICO|nr:hypothetical protein [Brachybacterium nesterenkovii]SLM93693.1 hypothetical protein FM110_10255 [Brachybacterium nesterenkovii]